MARIKNESIAKEKEYEIKKQELMNNYEKEIEMIKKDVEKRMTNIEKRCEENIILKYHRVILEIVDEEKLENLSQESKEIIVSEIVDQEKKSYNGTITNNLIEHILAVKQCYEIISTKNKKLISDNQHDEMIQFIINHFNIFKHIDGNNGIKIDNEGIECLHNKKIFNEVLNGLKSKFHQIQLNLKYTSKSFENTRSIVCELIKNDDKFSNSINIALSIKNLEYFDHNFEINNLVSECQIEISQDKMKKEQFCSMQNLRKCVIRGGLKSICESSFKNLTKLIEVKLPSTVTTILDNAFENCASLTQITIPSSVTKIGNNAFKGCKALKNISIPSSITTIGDNVFENCDSLDQIEIPSSITKIGNNTFKGCKALKNISISSTVTMIHDNAFENCASLTQITIPSSVTKIGNNAFKGCKALKNISIPSSITTIGDNVFENCDSLNQIEMPIDNCASLKRFIFFASTKQTKSEQNGKNQNGKSIFNCTNINENLFNELSVEAQSVIISKIQQVRCGYKRNDEILQRLQKIQNLLSYFNKEKQRTKSSTKTNQYISIENNESQEYISIQSDIIEILYENKVLDSNEFTTHLNSLSNVLIEIKYPSQKYSNVYEKVIKLKNSMKNKLKICIFITGVECTDQQFHGNKNIDIVKLDNGLTKILSNGSSGSFEGCTSLAKVIIPSSAVEIGRYALASCTSLTQVTIPSSVKKLSDNAFCNCQSLKQVTLSSSLTSIESYTFQSCHSLEQITIPSSVTSIGSCAFDGCKSLTQITIPSSVKSIGDSAFRNCSSLKQISAPSSLNLNNTRIGSNVKVIKILI